MPIKLVAIDMDGTFLKDDKTYHKDYFENIFNRLMEREIKVLIASGNTNDKLRSYFTDKQIDNLYFAGDNGSHIYKGNQLLHEEAMDAGLVQQIEDYAKGLKDYHLYVSTGQEAYILEGASKEIYQLINSYSDELHEVSTFNQVPSNKKIFKLTFSAFLPMSTHKKVMADLNKNFKELQAFTSGPEFIDTISAQSGKGSAVRYFHERYGIKPEETIAFGDSLNDVSMMQASYYSMAMANADPDLKEYCRFEVPSNEEDGVLITLEKYLDQENLDFL